MLSSYPTDSSSSCSLRTRCCVLFTYDFGFYPIIIDSLISSLLPITNILFHFCIPSALTRFFLLHSESFIMVSQPKTPPPFGDKNASAGILATTILTTVLSIVLVTLRFATRIWIVKRVGWDDWCILFACVRMFRSHFPSKMLNSLSLDFHLGQHWTSPRSYTALADQRITQPNISSKSFRNTHTESGFKYDKQTFTCLDLKS